MSTSVCLSRQRFSPCRPPSLELAGDPLDAALVVEQRVAAAARVHHGRALVGPQLRHGGQVVVPPEKKEYKNINTLISLVICSYSTYM